MKPTGPCISLFLALFALTHTAWGLDSPFLKTLVTTVPNGVVIAYGSDPGSFDAANVIANAIRRIPGQSGWDQMVKAADFDAQDFTVTGQVHVIAVGTLADNVVLQGRSWLPTWWMDWDWYNTKFPLALTGDRLGLPYQPTSGFTAAGYGDWPKGTGGVGLVEVDRSHLFAEWMVRSRINLVAGAQIPESGDKHAFGQVSEKIMDDGKPPDQGEFTSKYPVYPKDFPLRLIVRITGSGPAGLLAAANAFANGQMVGGVVLAGGTAVGAGPDQAALPAERYASKLPLVPPASAGSTTYVGWLLPDAFEYDGLLADTGVRPIQMFRIKYMPASGITSFWTTPHRRAGEFEIACMKFADPDTAAKAAAAIDAAAKNLQPFKDGRVTNWGVAVNGADVYVRSLVGEDGAQLLSKFAQMPEW